MEGAPAQPAGVWTTAFPMSSYDVDFRKQATPISIFRIFLEAAWNHAEQLGFGFGALAAQEKLWVLARISIEISMYPRWGDKVSLSTWPRGTSGLFALRDFEIVDQENRMLVAGTSGWLILDAKSHRPQRPDKMNLPGMSGEARTALGRDPQKLPRPERLEAPKSSAVASYCDIDVNDHVNSVTYVGWLLDSYSAEFHHSHSLRSIEVNYIGETRWGDAVSIVTQPASSLQFAHWIVRTDQSEVCRAVFHWIPQQD
ncbi:MAG TPA: acyl-ACP thioesterase domain-containing protein [Verrucomicrobiae bacterium]|nr:acyl-ACP thioesterase domain-containing protein [Verrucomicrobiae bacterium]